MVVLQSHTRFEQNLLYQHRLMAIDAILQPTDIRMSDLLRANEGGLDMAVTFPSEKATKLMRGQVAPSTTLARSSSLELYT